MDYHVIAQILLMESCMDTGVNGGEYEAMYRH